jgi:uncharacterized protein
VDVVTRRRAGLVHTALVVCLTGFLWAGQAFAQAIPELTAPVNDFAGVIDAESRATLDRVIRTLQQGTGDVIVVATIPTYAPAYADIREYAVKMFENGGRGVGDKAKDNGLLVLVAVDDRKVWIEVGYGLEGPITDGFSGSTSRNDMVPFFRTGEYGKGLVAGVTRLAGRIAEERGVTLADLPRLAARPQRAAPRTVRLDAKWILALVIGIILLNMIISAMTPKSLRGRRRGGGWSSGGWSGWSGGGSFGGGSFGGGFGGFGGGGSGGGGGGASW